MKTGVIEVLEQWREEDKARSWCIRNGILSPEGVEIILDQGIHHVMHCVSKVELDYAQVDIMSLQAKNLTEKLAIYIQSK